MFTIYYTDVTGERARQTFDSKSRQRLAHHLAQFPRPILDIYEQTTLISGAMRKEMQQWAGALNMSNAAREFMNRQ